MIGPDPHPNTDDQVSGAQLGDDGGVGVQNPVRPK